MSGWKRWMCPTDRQLTLRSKLQKGWTNLQCPQIEPDASCPSSAVTADELRKITSVIGDNERLLSLDRKRIGRYTEKLTVLKARVVGQNGCHLCGEKLPGIFASLTSGRLQCSLCGLVTCSKCGTTPGSPGETAPERQEKVDTRPWLCAMLFRERQQPTDWQCKICHKELQLWKRSGAWFYNPSTKHCDYPSAANSPDTETSNQNYAFVKVDIAVMCDHEPGQNAGETNGAASGRTTAQYGATASPEPRYDANQPASRPPNHGTDFADRGLGALHFVLQYIPSKATLYIRIIKGERLRAHDANGLSDPYVKMHLLPDTGKRTKMRTRTCQRTLNPVWDEEFCYSGVTKAEMASKMLRLSVLDEDTIGFDWMGEILYPLSHLLLHLRKEYSEVFLQPKNFELDKSLKLEQDDRGKIMVGLYYAPAKNELAVRVLQCVNLIAMDPNGYSDPFIKLHLKPDDGTPKKCKTEVKRRTLNPEFEEEFYFKVTPQELPQKTLEITVWDKDFASKNDFMGALVLGNRCTGERWSHWEVLLRQPYQRHDRWYALSPELQLAD